MQPQFLEYAPAPPPEDNGGDNAGRPASSPYWEEPAASPYWDAAELADYYAGSSSYDDELDAGFAAEPTAPSAGASPDILDGLTPEQQRAVQHTEGPLIIVAGPGAGKTLVIVRRIAHLVRDCNVAPWQILAVTFTNRAAREMRERLDAFLPGRSQAVTMGTFHSVCARILRRHGERVGLGRNFTIYDQDDQIAAVKSAMQLADVDAKHYPPRAVLSRISAAKNKMQDSEQMRQTAYHAEDEYEAHRIDACARVYRYYEEALSRQNAVDFDDLLVRTVNLLENAPEVREQYHRRYHHLMIDEFQDTNIPQYRLVRLLTGTHHNLCVVGDVDQSIYSWRGANIENYTAFRKDFPENRIIFDLNFRSGQKILDAADSVILGDTYVPRSMVQTGSGQQHTAASSALDGLLASLWRGIREWLWGPVDQDGSPASMPANASEPRHTPVRPRLKSAIGEPGTVSLTELDNEEQEAAWAVNEITALARSGRFRRGGCAIMYRTNAQSRAFEEQCLKRGIPYRLVGGVRFYTRREIKDALCYLRVIYNPDDEVSLLRIINTPPRGIGAKTLRTLADFAAAQGITMRAAMREVAAARSESRAAPVRITARAVKSIADLSVTLDRLGDAARELGVADLLDRTLDLSGLARQIHTEDGGEERWENIQELRGLAEEYGPAGDGSANGLSAFLERVSLVSDVDSYEQSDDALTLITLHQAKGLEFPVVMMAGMEEGLLPHSRSMDTQDEIDEERRLCYVGMTRAQQRLYLSYAGYRRSRPTQPSPFLNDLPDEVRAGTPLQGNVKRYRFTESEIGTADGYAPNPVARPTRNADAVIGGDYGRARRESRTRLGEAGAASAGNRTRGGLRGGIDDRLTEWVSHRPEPASAASATARPPRAPLAVGEIVRHPSFGEGVVQEVHGSGDTEQATVNFGGGIGLKRLLVSLARLQRG